MKAFDVFTTLGMLAILTAFVVTANFYPPGARFMPFVVGIPAIGLCLLQLILDLRARGIPHVKTLPPLPVSGPGAEAIEAAELEPELSQWETIRREIVMWVFILAFIGAILLFGFWIAIPVFLVSFLRFQASANWRLALSLSLAATIFLYLAVEQGFRIELHRGFVTQAVSDRLFASE
jgi:hypothetical protein